MYIDPHFFQLFLYLACGAVGTHRVDQNPANRPALSRPFQCRNDLPARFIIGENIKSQMDMMSCPINICNDPVDRIIIVRK